MKRRLLLTSALLLVNTGCTAIIDAGSYGFVSDAGRKASDASMIDASAVKDDAGSNDGGTGVTPGITPDKDAIEVTVFALAKWACIELSRCESRLGDGVAGRAKLISFCHPDAVRSMHLSALMAAIDAGRTAFNNAKVKDCLAALAIPGTNCNADLTASTVTACSGVFTGTEGADKRCDLDVECAAGLVCHGLGMSCNASCQPPGRQGDACVDGSDCDQGFSCLSAECVAKSGAGLPCKSDDGCRENLYCSTDEVCVAKGAADKPCVVGNQMTCADGLLCVKPASSGKPATCGAGVALGGDCSAERPCVARGRCVDGSCVLVTVPGGTCNSDSNCPTATACIEGQCKARAVVGEACDESSAASPRIECIGGICKDGRCALGKDGAACPFDLAVPFAACVGYCSAAGRCITATKIAGTTCAGDYECANGLACVPSTAEDSSVATCQQPCN